MTGQEFSEVDFDLLADYVGGALDGTPEEDVVARRVAEDPAWAEAHAALAEATGSVRASLASWGESAEPMPTEVADRIATALAREPHRPALSLVPGEGDGPARTARRARRRLPAWAGPAAIAAGIAALAGFGLGQADNLGGGSEDSAGTAVDAPVAAPNQAEGRPGSGTDQARAVPLAATGTDYRAAGLPRVASPLSAEQGKFSRSTGGATTMNQPPAAADVAAPPGLERLKDPAALAACIDAIAGAHVPGIIDVEVVDLASFEGSPAAVVFFTDGSGARWVWASGPECGLAARGADTRGSAKIG